MARIRTLKPEVWMSAQVMNLEHSSRLLFIGLITQADDEGRGSADIRRLKASIFGGDDCTSTDVRRWLDEISAQDLCVIYNDEKHGLLYALPSWSQHQSIDRPRKSQYPPPTETTADRRTIDESASTIREGSDRTVPEGRNFRTEPDQTVPTRACVRDDAADHERFLEFRAAYPKFSGRENWIMAEHHYRLRLERGATPDDLLAAANRYGAYVAAGGVSSTAHVLRPENFLSAGDDPWKQAWDLPRLIPKAETPKTTWRPPPDDAPPQEVAGA